MVKWLYTEQQVERDIIQNVEQKFGVKFPSEYIDCVMNFNGGYPEPNMFNCDNGIQGVFNDLISFTNEDLNISMFYDFLDEPLTKGIVPFGRDPFGNLLGFDYRGLQSNPTIVFFDQEESEIYPVCNTFGELLKGL